ncbi:MAG: multicopper oxidase domain-containing protein [Cyanobacteria bacterium P01_G01_bin.39]
MTESPEQKNQPNFLESESSRPILNRRQFIGAGAAAAAALILPKSAQADSEIANGSVKIAQANPICTPPSLTPPSDTSFVQPNIIASQKLSSTDNYCTLRSSLDIVAKDYTDLTTPPDPMTYVRAFEQVDPPVAPTPGFAPGPTLCVNPGDLISLNTTNRLPINTPPPPSTGGESTYCKPNQGAFPIGNTHNTPGCFNSTNLHFHGLHVSPISLTSNGTPISSGQDQTVAKSSDDVLYDLKPGASHEYCPWLPAFHAPGTHWYHAHHHGSTAIQVGGGMVGAIIVKEPAGQEICPGAADVVMLIEEEAQSLTGINDLTAQENLDRGIYERTGIANTGTFRVNGQGLDAQGNPPTLTLENGEVQRWRIINANSTPRALIKLELRANNADGSPNQNGALQTLYRIAVDGITLYGKPVEVLNSSVSFAPGNRFDFLVNLPPNTGNYTLWKTIDPNLVSRQLAGNSKPQALVSIQVSSTPPVPADKYSEVQENLSDLIANKIPITGRPDYLKPITASDKVKENQTPVVFQIPNRAATPSDPVTTAGRGDYRISNTKYDSSNFANIRADLNSTEEWIVANTSGATHPFHIHVNPFLVVATADLTGITINGTTDQALYNQLTAANVPWKEQNDGIWWDTFPIESNKAYKIRHRFDDYWGNFVLHCHILIHEDQGMMWNVQINNVQNKGADPCQQLLEPVVISSSNPFSTGTKIALQADTGKWLSRCNNCQQTVGNNYPDTITVHIDNPDSSNPYAQFEVLDVGGGKIALKADTGKYIARCRNCIINGAYPDFLTVHVDDPDLPYAQFTPERLDNGKYALKADTGKYVARCRNCSTGAAYSDTVTIHVDDPTNAPYAQWNIQLIQ